ncbi:MAG: hypothetical protein DBX39_05510 [Bacillota bacterium]|nr:MAG: hypothetical protein DBX39_05510 [Bacillota bacterium]
MGEDGKRSALAEEVLAKCGKTYIESSVSGKGIHVFGKTKGMDLRSFSKDGDIRFIPVQIAVKATTTILFPRWDIRSWTSPFLQRVRIRDM